MASERRRGRMTSRATPRSTKCTYIAEKEAELSRLHLAEMESKRIERDARIKKEEEEMALLLGELEEGDIDINSGSNIESLLDEQEIAEAIGQEDAAVAVLTCKQQLTSK